MNAVSINGREASSARRAGRALKSLLYLNRKAAEMAAKTLHRININVLATGVLGVRLSIPSSRPCGR